MNEFEPSHIPDYRRLQKLTKRIPELDPDELMTMLMIRSVAEELTGMLQADLDKHGITEGRMRVMGHLLDRERPSTHTELALASRVTKGTVTGLIDGLERDGLVRRIPCPEDRRVSLIELTEQGESLLQRILPDHLRQLSRLVSGISQEEQHTLIKILKKLRDGLFPGADIDICGKTDEEKA